MGDRWTLELLLAAAPWITGNRNTEDKYLSTQLGAVEMVLKGCTACYDLSFEWPLPTTEGLARPRRLMPMSGCARSCADGRHRSFYEAIPGLRDALPPPLQKRVAELRLPPAEATLAAIRGALQGWSRDRDRVRPRWHQRSAPLLRCVHIGLRGAGAGSRCRLHSHVAESKVQAVTGIRLYGRTQTAHLEALGVLGPHFTVAHGVWLDEDDMALLGDRGARSRTTGQQHAARQRARDTRAMLERRVNLGSAPMGRIAPTIRTCTRRCGWPRSSPRCRARIGGAG